MNYELYPWSRALELTRGGELDCVFGASHGDEPNFAFMQHQLGNSSAVIFTLASNPWMLKGEDSLRAVKLGAITDFVGVVVTVGVTV